MTQKNRKASASMPLNMGSIMMRAAGVLLCLVLFSVHLMGGLYARYTSSGSGNDEARVAKFEVTEDQTDFQLDEIISFEPGEKEQTITVSNKSEVAIRCTITLENVTGNIPLSFQVGDIPGPSGSIDLAPDSTGSCTIKIIWAQQGAHQYAGMVDYIAISLHAEQID